MREPTITDFHNLLNILETSLAELFDAQAEHQRQITALHRTLRTYIRTVRDNTTRPLLKELSYESPVV